MEENEIQDLLNAILFSQTPQWNLVAYNPSKYIQCQISIQKLRRWILGNNTCYKKLHLLLDQLFFGLWKIIISNKRQLIFTAYYTLLHTPQNKQTHFNSCFYPHSTSFYMLLIHMPLLLILIHLQTVNTALILSQTLPSLLKDLWTHPCPVTTCHEVLSANFAT
jgi:hypothetical protein